MIGCATRIGANGEAGKGFDGNDMFCLVTDTLLFTPAWRVALAASLLKTIIEWIPNAIEAQAEFQTLRDEETLQQRRVDEWNKRQPQAYDHLKTSLGRDEFRNNVEMQLKAETVALLFSGAQVAGGLHAGALQAATDAKQRGKINANNLYPGGLPLNIQICAEFAARKSRLRDDLIKEAQEAMRREQGSFDDYFFGKVKDSLVENALSVDPVMGPRVTPPEQLKNYADGVRSKRSLPPPLSDTQIASVQKIVDEALLRWKPRACSGFCRQDDDPDCQWANCGPEPPTDQQVKSNGLVQVFEDSAYLVDKTMSASCQESYGRQCGQQVLLAKGRNYPVQPSKLLCKSRSKPADIDPVALNETFSLLAAPDFDDFSRLFPTISGPCGREMCPVEPSSTANMILVKNIPQNEAVRKEAIGLISGKYQGFFQDTSPQGWEACYSSAYMKTENKEISAAVIFRKDEFLPRAAAVSEPLAYIEDNLKQGICRGCYRGNGEWVLGCGLKTADWSKKEPTST